MSVETLNTSQPFNMRQWAIDHDRRDNERFEAMAKNVDAIWKVFAAVAMVLVGVFGWSLKNQYEMLQAQDASTRALLNATYTVQRQVQAVSGQPAVPNR